MGNQFDMTLSQPAVEPGGKSEASIIVMISDKS